MASPHHNRIRFFTTLGLAAGGVAFFLTLLDFSTSLTRTTLGTGYASGFFDLQARALLDGRWAVPDGSLSIEGFVRSGVTYTYFPPFPALLRMPILFTTDLFDGRLTILSMGVGWIVFAAMTTRLVWLLRRRFTGRAELSNGEGALISLFLALATGGTTLTFVAGQPWVYHEVYLWASAGAVGAAYWMLRVLEQPTPSAIGWLAAFCAICVGSRTTAGWAVCLTVIALGLWIATGRPTPGYRRRWWAVSLAGALPWLAGIALNLHKFGHVYMFPLQDQVWTSLSEHRQEALEVNGGTITGLQFFTTAFMAYFRLDGIRFVEWFPFVTLPAAPPPAYDGAFIDQAYRTGSVTAFMPALLILTALAALVLLKPGSPAHVRHLRPVLVAMILITGGVMAYGYFATRYVSDFVPALVVGGAIGTAWLCRWSHQRRPRLIVATTFLAIGAAWSLCVQVIVGFSMAAIVHEGEQLERYLSLQQSLTPGRAPVSTGDQQPTGGRTDQLHIRGDCDTLYLNTGDPYRRWVVVSQRDRLLNVWLERGKDRAARLASVQGEAGYELWLERLDKNWFQLSFRSGDQVQAAPVQEIPLDGRIRIGIRNRTDVGYFEVTSNPGGQPLLIPASHHDEDFNIFPSDFEIDADPEALQRLKADLSIRDGAASDLCRRIQDDAAAAR